jgi:CsoR family transcriptional regulator, copper-sensing transcriptional repressor
MYTERQKRETLMRLRRIEGQVRGLQKMVEKETPCSDILTQVAAVTAAIKRVGRVVVQTSMQECLEKNQKESGIKRVDSLRDLQEAISHYIDWA